MENKAKYLHLAFIFKASNLNYGESVGNILSLKKISCDGKNYSYISRQAIRYDIVRMLKETFNYDYADVDKKGGVIQFITEANIEQFPEIDFFGYMKTTEGNKIRKAVVRLTDAVSLESFNNEIDFSTNKGLADRNEELKNSNDIYQSEIHKSYYSYTITCNLEKIGKDEIDNIDIENKEKAQRLCNLIDVIKLLYRDIRGKRENLAPLFVIGGLYNVGNPFFYNRLKLSFTKEKTLIDNALLNDILTLTTVNNKTVKEQTEIGFLNGIFSNIEDISADKKSIEEFFKGLKDKIKTFYGV
ncbi:MAG: type I-B CRISPR-associated protein Cas7/Cst2/DevR [Deltaproteobacteria bacterium]|nr:type I-B CRISPR-associated protein Cas7/Cst2/DevR [Deltaproteobacteria bacterium]